MNTGQLIKEVFESRGMTKAAFADDINYSRQNIYPVFGRDSIQTNLLHKICLSLKYNFFKHLSDEVEVLLDGNGHSAALDTPDHMFKTMKVKSEINQIRDENNHLQKQIKLMEELLVQYRSKS